jgi:CheY-like chemotaxis protein
MFSKKSILFAFTLVFVLAAISPTAMAQSSNEDIVRIGMIGLDTSHSPSFTETINDPEAEGLFTKYEVVAAYPKGSLVIESSYNRIPEYTEEVRGMGVEIVDSIDELLEQVDVVLLDRRMPGMTGDELLEEIRRRGFDCRIVMLTAVDPDFDIAEMDIDDYVVKPVDREELLAVVDRALTISEYNEQMQELSSLKLKRNVLEVELSGRELEESEKYRQLQSDIEELEAEIQSMEDTLDIDQVDLYL